MVEKAYSSTASQGLRPKTQLFINKQFQMSYISHVDYKSMMENFKKGAPKQMLKESLDPVGKEDDDINNDGKVDKTDKYLSSRRQAIGKSIGKGRMMREGNEEVDKKLEKIADLHKGKKIDFETIEKIAKALESQGHEVNARYVQQFLSQHGVGLNERHEANDMWYEDFEDGLQNLAKNKYISPLELQYYMKALDHVDPMDKYSDFDGHDAAKEFVDDLRSKDEPTHDYEPDTDADYEEPRDDFDMAGDFNDGEFWENEVKKLKEIAGIRESHPANDQWYDDFKDVLANSKMSDKGKQQVIQALDSMDVVGKYGDMEPKEAFKKFVWDLIHASTGTKREGLEFTDDDAEDPQAAKDARAKKMEDNDTDAENAEIDEEANPSKSYHGSSANQGATGATIDFTVIENTPEYFKIDYVITPNSGRAPMGASRSYRPEKKYGEWKISKVGDKGQPLTDYEKTQLNIKGDRFGVNGKEFVQDIYGSTGAVAEGEETKLNLRAPEQAAKNVANKYGTELKPEYDEYQRSYEEYIQAIRNYNSTDPEFREIAGAHNKLVKAYQNKVLGLARQEMEDGGEKPVVAKNLAYGYSDEDWPSEFVTALGKEMKGMQEGLNEFGGHGDAPDDPKLQAAVKYLVQNRDRFLTQDYFFPHAISTLSLKSDKDLYDYIVNNWHSDEVYDVVAHMKSQIEKDMYANTDPNIADPINEGSDYNKIIPALKARGIRYGMPEKEIIKEKIHESAINTRMLDESSTSSSMRSLEQNLALEKQNQEINHLQQTLGNIEKEAEFLREKNKILTQKILHFRNQAVNIIESVNNEVNKIEEILKSHDS